MFPACASCFFWLRQLRRVWRSLDDESMKTLVHALWQLELTTATWYWPANQSLWLTNYNGCWTLPHISSAAHASTTVDCHADLHWLNVADGVRYRLGVTEHRCLHNKAPQYLVDCCTPLSDIASRQRLRSARRCLLTVPRHRRSTLGRRAFSVAGPTVWNLLPDQLRDSDCTESTFRQSLKTFFFNEY